MLDGVKGWLYSGPIRNLLRRASLAGPVSRLLRSRRPAYVPHLEVEGSVVEVSLVGLSARFAVESEAEINNLRQLGNESAILVSFLEQVRAGDVVYDVGANLGLYGLLASSKVGPTGRVILFEPEKKTLERLRRNVELNGRCDVVDVALGRRNGTMSIQAGTSPMVGTHGAYGDGSDRYEVRVERGDSLVEELGLPPPSVVKIDVEGMEADVVAGLEKMLQAESCRHLLCELHFSVLARSGQRGVSKDLVDRLRDFGFSELRWPDPSHIFAHKPATAG